MFGTTVTLVFLTALVATNPISSTNLAGQALSNGIKAAGSYQGPLCNGPASSPITSYQPASSTQLPTSSTPGSTCPMNLAGVEFQYPHLIVTSSGGQKTSSTGYKAVIGSTAASAFNFDIPLSYAGKTCDVVFALPRQDQLQTSSFHLSGKGPLHFYSLKTAANEHADMPEVSSTLGSWDPAPGDRFVMASGTCAAGQSVAYSISADGDRYLEYFQDYNPCPIGLYVIVR